MGEGVRTKAEVLAALRARREEIARLGVFGSFVRGEQTERSDVDVLVEFRPGAKTFENFMHLAFLLEETLGRRVELVTAESLSPYIGPHVLREVEYVDLVA